MQHPACLPITKATYSFILLVITIEQLCLFFFCWTERSHLCSALFTPARDCLRCFSAAALLLMEAKPAYNSLWQVIQTHNIKIRSSHWSSQLKKPPQAIARRLLAVAAEFKRLKICLLFCGEIPGYFVEAMRITNGQTIESVEVLLQWWRSLNRLIHVWSDCIYSSFLRKCMYLFEMLMSEVMNKELRWRNCKSKFNEQ